MTRASKARIAAVALFSVFFGIREDIDYCQYTAEWRSCLRVWGVPIPFTQRHNDGFRVWLEQDLGAHFPQSYLDYLNFHPLLAVASTPRGNWMFLNGLKKVYDTDPNSHVEVATLVKTVAGRIPPRPNDEDYGALNALVNKHLP